MAKARRQSNDKRPQVTVLTSGSGQYIPPTNTAYLRIRMVGGSGTGVSGNGAAGSSSVFGGLIAGAGGGSGGYVEAISTLLANSYSYSVGTGGTGAAGGSGAAGIIIVEAY